MRRLIAAGLVAAVVVFLALPAFAVDDEQALFNEIAKGLKVQINPQGKTEDEFKNEIVKHVETLVAQSDDYRKRFPTGPNIVVACMNEANMLFFLASIPGNADKTAAGIEKAGEVSRQAVDADPKGVNAPKARMLLARYYVTKSQTARTPQEGAPFMAEAEKQAKIILADFPASDTVPSALDFLAAAREDAGDDKEATAYYEKLVQQYPDTPFGKNADNTLKQMKLKGTALDLHVTSTAGEVIDLKNYRGKVVIVDFWATWCGPCKAGMPKVIEMEKQYRDRGLRIIGVSLDQDKAMLEAYVKEMNMPWPQYFDGGVPNAPMATKCFISAIPTTFLIDKAGVVREIDHDTSKLEDSVKKLLEEKAP